MTAKEVVTQFSLLQWNGEGGGPTIPPETDKGSRS